MSTFSSDYRVYQFGLDPSAGSNQNFRPANDSPDTLFLSHTDAYNRDFVFNTPRGMIPPHCDRSLGSRKWRLGGKYGFSPQVAFGYGLEGYHANRQFGVLIL